MFHPTAFPSPDPTGAQAVRAATLAEVTTELDRAGITASTLMVGPDDKVLITLDSGDEFLATLLALDLEPVDSAGSARYARGLWRGVRVVAATGGLR